MSQNQNLGRCTGLIALALLTTLPTLAQQSSLYGTVQDVEAQMPLLEAEVYLLQGQRLVQSTTTNIDGHFYMQHLEAGAYQLKIRFPGYQEAHYDLSLTGADRQRVAAKLPLRTEMQPAAPVQTVVWVAPQGQQRTPYRQQ